MGELRGRRRRGGRKVLEDIGGGLWLDFQAVLHVSIASVWHCVQPTPMIVNAKA